MAKRIINEWVRQSDRQPYVPSSTCHGFVYLIIDMEAGLRYIGKKQAYTKTDMRKYKERKPSNWETYRTS